MSKDGRRRCVVRLPDGRTFSVQYGKILLIEKFNRLLLPTEECDHIDQDKTNDDLSNLRIISVEEHRKKNSVLNTRRVEKNCPECGKLFKLKPNRHKMNPNSCCSRSCGSKYIGANAVAKWGRGREV